MGQATQKGRGWRSQGTSTAPTPTCEMLMKEPLEPAVTMRTTLLVSFRLFCASLPASSRALFRHWFTCARAQEKTAMKRVLLARLQAAGQTAGYALGYALV